MMNFLKPNLIFSKDKKINRLELTEGGQKLQLTFLAACGGSSFIDAYGNRYNFDGHLWKQSLPETFIPIEFKEN